MRRNLIVVGASAGGVEALRSLVAGLPPDLPAAVLVVLHVPSYGGSVLPAILERAGDLPADHPEGEQPLEEGRIYVAPPDHHLLVVDGHCVVTRGPRENGHRPAIDVLFRSAARADGPRVIGVVLSGVLDDGTAGLQAIAQRGGTTIVQDPADALYDAMPRSALEHVPVDHVAPAAEIGNLLARLAKVVVVDRGEPTPRLMETEIEVALMEEHVMHEDERPGRPSAFSCPDCSGVLWEIHDGDLVRYRCRVGHAWSADSLLGQQAEQLDSALWMALRGLEEKAALARTLASRARDRNSPLMSQRYEEQATEATRAAETLRSMLARHVGSADDVVEG
jgi:two-component system chemotaxis response regulator CheB